MDIYSLVLSILAKQHLAQTKDLYKSKRSKARFC